jgi:4-aminobutyrate aminotransferase-like enzyme
VRAGALARPAAPIVEAALANRLVVGSAGERVLRLTPPLTLSLDEAALALTLLEGVVT